jgi:putative ABC transport system permease protein
VGARDAASLTLASLRAHKLRSVLAAIGVTLGIAAVVGIVTAGAGFQDAVTSLIDGQVDGTSILVGVSTPGQEGPGDASSAANLATKAFTDRDVAALSALPDVKDDSASQILVGAEVYASNGALLPATVVTARTGPFVATLLDGRQATAANEATVTNATADALTRIEGRAALGSTLNVAANGANLTFTVVGIEKALAFGPGSAFGVSVGPALAPAVAVGGAPTHAWTSVSLHATDAAHLPAAEKEVASYLAARSDARSRLAPDQSFSYSTRDDVARTITGAIDQFTLFVGAVGAIALLVGLVGIANIMLVSVSERTREIGVMKAIGATSKEVLALFLLDAVAICLVGAALGIGLGSLLGYGLDQLVGSVTGAGGVPFVIVTNWYAIAVGISVLIGVLAGLYPAWRAARVSPVAALRYE